jgi:hypothetical protein
VLVATPLLARFLNLIPPSFAQVGLVKVAPTTAAGARGARTTAAASARTAGAAGTSGARATAPTSARTTGAARATTAATRAATAPHTCKRRGRAER